MKFRRLWIILALTGTVTLAFVLILRLVIQQPSSVLQNTTHHLKVQDDDPFLKGREFLYSGKYKEAEQEFKKVLRNDPYHVKALSALGTLYYRMGDISRAKQYWNEALKLSPNDPIISGLLDKTDNSENTSGETDSWQSHFEKGEDLYSKGDYKQALKELKQAVSIKNDDPKIYFVLGAAYLKNDMRGEAIKVWEKALELDPEDKMIRELLYKARNPET